MDATTWLRHVGAYCPEPLHGPKLARVVAFALRFDAEFPARAFTTDTARRVAKALPDTHPTFEQIAGALRFAMPAEEALPAPAIPTERPRFGMEFITRRLREGGDRAHLLSLCRAYDPPEVVREVMAAHFPEELRAEDERAAEVKRDKARNAASLAAAQVRAVQAEAVARAVGGTLRAAPLHAPPAPPVVALPAHLDRQQQAPAPRESPVHRLQMLRQLEAEVAGGQATPAAQAVAVAMRASLEGEAKRLLRELDKPREQESAHAG
jgi:hypothetical protein